MNEISQASELAGFFPFWDKLSQPMKEQLIRHVSVRKYPAKTAIYQGRQNCLGLLLIRSGQIRAYIMTEEGRELTPLPAFFRGHLPVSPHPAYLTASSLIFFSQPSRTPKCCIFRRTFTGNVLNSPPRRLCTPMSLWHPAFPK